MTLSVNGVNAPLIYVSPTQINFQIPWEVAPDTLVPVVVTCDGTPGAPENGGIAAPRGARDVPQRIRQRTRLGRHRGSGRETNRMRRAGRWKLPAMGQFARANERAPRRRPSRRLQRIVTPLEVPGGPASCHLTIGGQAASVQYCGAAPGEIIDQINFVYPSGVSSSSPYVEASLTINGVTGYFRVPAPSLPVGIQ